MCPMPMVLIGSYGGRSPSLPVAPIWHGKELVWIKDMKHNLSMLSQLVNYYKVGDEDAKLIENGLSPIKFMGYLYRAEKMGRNPYEIGLELVRLIKKERYIKMKEEDSISTGLSIILNSVEANVKDYFIFRTANRRANDKQIIYKKIRDKEGNSKEARLEVSKMRDEDEDGKELLWPGTFGGKVFVALHMIMDDIMREYGVVENPIEFHYADICKKLEVSGGGNYDLIRNEIRYLKNLSFRSFDIYYHKSEGKYLTNKSEFYLVTRISSEELRDAKGKVRTSKKGMAISELTKLYLDPVFLDNFNNGYLTKIDGVFALNLKHSLAFSLYQLLDTWFYAKRKSARPFGTPAFIPVYYSELCKRLNIKERDSHYSRKIQFQPALEELKKGKFLADYKWIEKDKKELLLRLWPGSRFEAELKEKEKRKNRFKQLEMAGL